MFAPSFQTLDDVLMWLRARGIEHVARVSVGALSSRVESASASDFGAVATRRRLVELLALDERARWVQQARPAPRLQELVPRLAWQFVTEELIAADEARALVAERLRAPADSRTHAVHTLLLELRGRLPAELAPRPQRMLAVDRLDRDEELPGFRLRPNHYSELPCGAETGFILAEASVQFAAERFTGSCSCRAAGCVHLLALIDTLLLRLHQLWTPEWGGALEEWVRPAWERALRALDRACDDDRSSSDESIEILWRLQVIDGYGVQVAPYLHRRNRKGRLTSGARTTRRKLLHEYGAHLSPLDARLAALLPDGDAPASRALLFELEGHPRLHLDYAPDQLVTVERAKVGLIAEERNGLVVVGAGIDGALLPTALAERVRTARIDEALYHWERGRCRLTVLDVSPELRALLGVFTRHGNVFPPESHAALIERLSKLSRRVPVAMPRSVMGELVEPTESLVLRLEVLSDGAVRAELRIRPLPDGPTFVPGMGVRDVHVRRGATAVHVVRDFVQERVAADAWKAALPLDTAEPEASPFGFLFAHAQGALGLVSACAEIDPKPELEWVGQPLRLLAPRGAESLRVVVDRKRSWFGVLGGLSVAGERVELARLLDAARRKDRFVSVTTDSYVEISSALRQALEGLADHVHTSRNGLEVSPAAAAAMRALEDAGAEVLADQTWKALAQRIFAADTLVPAVPEGFVGQLRSYQLDGFRWLAKLAAWNSGGVLADDMGLGKTIQALALLLERGRLGPQLVVAPTSVAWNWMVETQRFAPALRTVLFSESDDRGALLTRLGPHDVLVISYGLLTRDLERLAQVRFATVVFDEAQTLKNALTHRVRAARALQGEFKFALSGTPLENHLGELWSVFAVVFPGLLGSFESFRSRFAAPIEKGLDPTAAPALARVLRPFLLRRTKSQVESELPPRTDVQVPVILSSAEWQLYEDARLAALSELETRKSVLHEQQRRVEILAALTRLRLLASHPRLYDMGSKLESSKLARFLELIIELGGQGERALVFSQFTSHLALVRELLDARGIRYEYLDGRTPSAARAERVRAFQDGHAPLFLISLKAGGFGLNLTAATSVIHLDPWWNPAVEDQASDRAHRIGQRRPVTVYRLIARGTIEEQMLALHEQKRTLVAGVLEGKDAAGRLATEDLMAFLAQRCPEGANLSRELL